MEHYYLTNDFLNRFIRDDKKHNFQNEQKKIIKPKKKLNRNKCEHDNLFWILYNIVFGDDIEIKNMFVEEKMTKIKWMEELKTKFKLSKYIKVQPFLISKPCINVSALDMLSQHLSLSFIIIVDNTYIKINEAVPEVYYIVYDNGFKLDDGAKSIDLTKLYHIENYNKLLLSKTKYKVGELKDIALKLNIDITECKKKDAIYDKVYSSFKLNYLNIIL